VRSTPRAAARSGGTSRVRPRHSKPCVHRTGPIGTRNTAQTACCRRSGALATNPEAPASRTKAFLQVMHAFPHAPPDRSDVLEPARQMENMRRTQPDRTTPSHCPNNTPAQPHSHAHNHHLHTLYLDIRTPPRTPPRTPTTHPATQRSGRMAHPGNVGQSRSPTLRDARASAIQRSPRA
jgi:hypothetical protein